MSRFGQQLGAYVYLTPPAVIQNHTRSGVATTFWQTDADDGDAITGFKLFGVRFFAEPITVFWGDGNNDTISTGGGTASHTYGNLDSPGAPTPFRETTGGALSSITNSDAFADRTFIRGSVKVLSKLI
jgi:hypothetical protein